MAEKPRLETANQRQEDTLAEQELHRLTKYAFDKLREYAKANTGAYTNPETDFDAIIRRMCGDAEYREPVSASIECPLDLKNPAEYSENPRKRHLSDVQALKVHGALKGITPRLARDPNLWAYINHFYLHRYGIARWPAGDTPTVRHILDHWFTSDGDKVDIWKASISGRLWWISHIARKAAGASGGAFTAEEALKIFSDTPEYYHRTMEYEVLRNPVLMAECVRALMREAKGINRDGYRAMGAEINREAGARVLDSLSRDEIRQMVVKCADRLMRREEFVTSRHDMVGVKKFRVLSLGAGAQSTVLALMADQGAHDLERPDLAIFADTQWEPPAVYEHLEWLKKQVSYDIVTVSAGNIRDNIMNGVNPDGASFLDIPAFIVNKNGSRSVAARQCTNHYKIIPIHREIRRRLGVPAGRRVPKNIQVEMWLGISADESTRIKISRDEWIENKFPLVDMDMTRADVYNWFSARYPDRHLPRSACVGCPYHDDMEWKWLKDNEYESFKEAVAVDKALRDVPKVSGSLRGTAYLHKSRQSLDTVDFAKTRDYDEYMASECEGLCGV